MAGSPAGTPGPAVDAVPGVLRVDLGAGVRAGFTLRGGGGANLGLGVGDDPGRVLARRRALADAIGTPIAWATQVHGTGVLVRPVVLPDAVGSPLGEADALVVGRGAGAAVVVADCVPVLLADPAAGVGAAVHAGRRGLLDGVVQAAVEAMVAAGGRPGRIRAAVGPAICGRCYEVPADLRDEVADVVPGVASRTSWGTPALDLPAGVVTVLATAGVTAVHRTGWCTHTDERFYSHRRSTRTGEAPGRCAAVVAIGVATGGGTEGGTGEDTAGDGGRVGPGW